MPGPSVQKTICQITSEWGNMKKTFLVFIVLCLFSGFSGYVFAASDQFDDTTRQYLSDIRKANRELVAAHRELHNYNKPDRGPKRTSIGDILNQQEAQREAKRQEEEAMSKKASAEGRIDSLRKEIETLKQGLLKHHNGQLPQDVSSALQTDEGYTAHLISRIK